MGAPLTVEVAHCVQLPPLSQIWGLHVLLAVSQESPAQQLLLPPLVHAAFSSPQVEFASQVLLLPQVNPLQHGASAEHMASSPPHVGASKFEQSCKQINSDSSP